MSTNNFIFEHAIHVFEYGIHVFGAYGLYTFIKDSLVYLNRKSYNEFQEVELTNLQPSNLIETSSDSSDDGVIVNDSSESEDGGVSVLRKRKRN
jgi:hypothetical protein